MAGRLRLRDKAQIAGATNQEGRGKGHEIHSADVRYECRR